MKQIVILLFGLLCIVAISCNRKAKQEEDKQPLPLPEPTIMYEINVDSLEVIQGVVRPNQFLSDLLSDYNVNFQIIDRIARDFRPVFDVRKIKAGNQYTLLCDPDSNYTARYFIYEIDYTNFVVYSLQDSVYARRGEKHVEKRLEMATGVISSSLWNAMVNNGYDVNLAIRLSEIFAWTVDFFGIQKEDRFDILYERLYVEDKAIGSGKVLAARFNHFGKDQFAFYFEQDSVGDYFDEKAQSLQRAFLKAPLKYNRISSHFTNSRYHPVLKYHRPHHGVDYAAPAGTPVYAIGQGVVTKKGYQGGGAGNYLYIKHNSVYTTAYMHLKSFAKGISEGSRVSQGQLIGYVGSTGLSTGPHLDFRFFKNGSPVNPLKVESPPAKPVDGPYMTQYLEVVKLHMAELEKIRLGIWPSPIVTDTIRLAQ
ncbi:MAG: peptidoglycan DD-metalloendopeptidase family protein [Bacteroidales bacterium]|nr:peptidoglycan DD-metalloendopeptidase family protein [Bacteroidales bacterium]